MDKDTLYDKYLDENAGVFLELDGIRINRGKHLLLFKGVDLEGREIRVEMDLEKHPFGESTIICSLEEFTLKELTGNRDMYFQVYIKSNGRDYMDLYDYV